MSAVKPDRMYVLIDGLDLRTSRRLSRIAMARAQANAPKLSGMGSRGIQPYWGEGFFGLRWEADYLWYQNQGIRAFTMRSLAGKTIPMWIDDPTGKVQQENPKAERRIISGRRQVLLFRRAAKIGARKQVVSRDGRGRVLRRDVPASYPGAPGRIARREANQPHTTVGRAAGAIAGGNVGVRWRFPGTVGRKFLDYAITSVCTEAGLGIPPLYTTYGAV